MNAKRKILILAILIILAAGFLFYHFGHKGAAPTGNATLSWNANSEPDLAGYKIYYGPSPRTNDCPPGGYTSNIDAGKVTTYTLNNLADGKTYYFSVTSYNSAKKESCFSGEMRKNVAVSAMNRLRNIFKKK